MPEQLDPTAELLMGFDSKDSVRFDLEEIFESKPWLTLIRSLNKIPRLKQLVKEGLVKERTLVTVHPNGDLQKLNSKKLNYEYISDPKYGADTLEESTVLRYPNGDVMGLFLKGDVFKSSRDIPELIPETIRNRAFDGLSQIEFTKDNKGFHTPHRPATRDAVKWNPEARELVFGYTDGGTIEITDATRYQEEQYEKVYPLIRLMNAIYAKVLPIQYQEAARHKTARKRFRQAGTTFTTVTVNRNCPAALHKDDRNHPGLIAMTTVAAPGTTGGEFCFPQYALKVPVKPGSLLIAATSREWHCNLSRVNGLKFSVICYKRKLNSLKMLKIFKIKLQRKIRPRLPQ